ncbi:hypothetical protein BJX61DRAFT_79602 [Aspergillus egyptiacus]|nr:hypothetical protein BJX61DRAFT_79602 [Aspergillus egyptiacus]
MPPAQMDALGAFTYLSDNLPNWMTQLSALTAHTTAKHAEFAEAFRKHSTAPLKPRKRRNSSICSIRTHSAHGNEAASSLESGDGPAVISTRHNVIIHYDGYTQKALEELVRNIGTARNNLRKGKKAQLPLFGGRAGRMGGLSLLPAADSSTTGPDDQLLANIRSARARGPGPTGPQVPSKQEPPFDMADKHLELAYGFCETAAYEFLRAGRCDSELNSVKERFTVLLEVVTEEVRRLQQEKQEQEQDAAVEEKVESPSTPAEPPSLKRPALNESRIEVDDEQAEVEPIDLSAFRVSRLRR